MSFKLHIFMHIIKRAIVGMMSIWCVGIYVSAQTSPRIPLNETLRHEGVMSCSGSTCHSRQEATGIVVRQNEILTWRDDASTTGAHIRAYETLLGERAKAIVTRLGIMSPAFEAKECVSCHTDNVTPAQRGHKFTVKDGVGCESCHGASEKWLDGHFKGASHQTNITRGLFALEDAKTRADVCLACHMGSEETGQFVNHRMMAAGHPRISFELDLFTALQSHHSEDVDYHKRKKVQTGVRIWAIGQAMALKQQLQLFEKPLLNKDGIFPELVFFDCLACHRQISEKPGWQPSARQNPGRPNLRGTLKFNDASMIMLLATAKQIAPDLARRFDVEVNDFHGSLNHNGRSQAINLLMVSADALIAKIEVTKFSKRQTLDILDIVVTETLNRRYTDYVAAEQAIMAIDTLLSSMIAANQVARIDVTDMRTEINIAYDAVEYPNTYDQDRLTQALEVLHARLQELR